MSIIYLDCDGVLLDSNERLREMKEKAGFLEHTKESYYKYFSYADRHLEEWNYIIGEANPINDSIKILKELEPIENIVILTKCYSLYEKEIKIKKFKESGINSEIIFVPKGRKKHEVVDPKDNILIDDMKENIDGWIEAGGIGLLFTKDKNLKKLIKSFR